MHYMFKNVSLKGSVTHLEKKKSEKKLSIYANYLYC